ncbi:MAG: hypothetical protein HZRFUVUK_000275 [Candidatus Fervidibacterota bacterium]|jgi:endonuclease-3
MARLQKRSGKMKTLMSELDRLLSISYGRKRWRRCGGAVEILIRTILSQQTNDKASEVAYRRLLERFGSFENVMTASDEEVEAAIRPAGLSRQKARCIKSCLKRIMNDFGKLSLDQLEGMDVESAMSYLTSLHGVGVKTAACVLLFAFGKPVFPVDTHILRITKRLGIVGEEKDATEAQAYLDEVIPSKLKYQLHLNLIEHGRKVCRAREPLCHLCSLRRYCLYWRLKRQSKRTTRFNR